MDIDPRALTFDEGYAMSTRRSYTSDWTGFVTWCEGAGQQALPASPDTVAAYVDARSTVVKPATVGRSIAAIAEAHRDRGIADPTKSRSVRVAFKKMLRQRGGRQRQALGITFDLRNRMLAAAPSNGIRGLRNRAMLSVAYDIGCRRAELVAIQAEDISRWDDGTATVLIRKSKTDQAGMGHVRYLAADTVRRVGAWLDAAGFEDGALFRSIDRHERLGAVLPGGAVSKIWKRMARDAGVSEDVVQGISGHSTRVGMAQDMAANGIDLASVMVAGGWKSPAMVARYTERMNAKCGAAARLAALQGRQTAGG